MTGSAAYPLGSESQPTAYAASVEHAWIRTVPTDGRWCEACGLSEASWMGDPCPGSGAARRIERQVITLRSELIKAAYEGRNVLPDATDDQAHAIEAWATSLLDRRPE